MTRRPRPALLYRTSTGETVPVDTEPVGDPRERDLFRALATRSLRLADQADDDDAKRPDPPGTGHYA